MKLLVAAMLAWLVACSSNDPIKCDVDTDCLQGGVTGSCLDSPSSADKWCAFADPACTESGYRWGILAGDGLARECVGDASATDGGLSVTLSVMVDGTGNGSLVSSPAGIDCPSTCSAQFPTSTQVTLTPTAGADSWFMGFGGDCTGRTPCTLVLDGDASASAVFEPHGKVLWAQREGGAAYDFARAAAASTGGMYVAGVADAQESTYDGRIFVRKLAPATGAALWTRILSTQANDEAGARAVAIDRTTGDALIAGWFFGTLDLDGMVLDAANGQLFVARLQASDGTVAWARQAKATRRGTLDPDEPWLGIAVDQAGEVVVAAHSRQSFTFGTDMLSVAGQSDGILLKYSAAGDPVFGRSFGGTLEDLPTSLAMDDSGSIFVAGGFEGTATFGSGVTKTATGGRDGFVSKWTSSGAHSWTRAFGGQNRDVVESVSVDGNGRVLVAGDFTGNINLGGFDLFATAGTVNAFMGAFTTSGAHLWSRAADGAGIESARSTCLDDDGNLVVAAQFSAGMSVDDFVASGAGSLIATLDVSTGNLVRAESSTVQDVRAIACAPSQIVVVGSFRDQIQIGDNTLVSSGQNDQFWQSHVP